MISGMRSIAISSLAAVLTATLAISSPALAQGKGRGGGLNKVKGAVQERIIGNGSGGSGIDFDGLPPGLAKKDPLPPGLAKRSELPPGLAKGHATPPGLAKRDQLPPGLRR